MTTPNLPTPRIGIDVTSALTQGGGIGRYTRELVQALTEISPNYTFRLFSAKVPASLPVSNPLPTGEHIVYCPAPIGERWLYRLWHRLQLPLPVQLITGRLDLFHSPDFVLPPLAKGIPSLLTVHDLSFIHYPETFPEALVRYLNTVVPRSVARASHILADSQATKADLHNIWHVPQDKVTVLYSGVHERFRVIDDAHRIGTLRKKYDLGDVPFILSVGTVQPRKNYQMLIQAFKPVAERFPHHLYIAGGKGWLYDDMLAEIERQGLNGRVRFLGFIDDADLPTLYNAATLFAMPSLYEGFGLPLLEAMACGVPVLTSNVSSLPEVVGSGLDDGGTDAGYETAVQLSPHIPAAWTEAMLHLLASPKTQKQLITAGFQQAKKFTWNRAARQLLNIYQQLLLP